jgi:predicted phosphodiesterase
LRIFAISDIHIDFTENLDWLNNLSNFDYKNDILILGGDVTDNIMLFEKAMIELRNRFCEVIFVPGNHDLWVFRNPLKDSLEKFELIQTINQNCGIRMEPFCFNSILIVPLFSWYDYSFGQPTDKTYEVWMDYNTCKWPDHWQENSITNHFISMNESRLKIPHKVQLTKIISFSHFLPRIDLLPFYIPASKRYLNPVLGTSLLEQQIRDLNSNIHVYGHSHVNVEIKKEQTLYINNAFGYPYEFGITAKHLKCILEDI